MTIYSSQPTFADIDPASIVRPFWPGGDYERFDYPSGCFVLDNPPFSLISKIVRFYMRCGVRFLLFAPALSLFSAADSGTNYLCCGETKKLRKYSIPHDVATAARLNWLSIHGEAFRIRRSDAVFIRGLDCGINLFGGGFLLSERAAAERAVLSDRERDMQKRLGVEP